MNGAYFVQTFFFLSGFLNSITLYRYMDKNELKGVKLWIITVILRYVRFTPVLLFFVWFDSSWLYHMGSGPYWDKTAFGMRQACRTNWWKSLIYINNYSRDNLKCTGHSWFLASDIQLSVVGSALLIFIRQ